MEAVYRLTRKVARTNASVLLLGETGSGKEMIATAIHRLSLRASGPFVRVNCGALSESLLESELFGHVRGAFTGAVNNRTGRFEAAHTGSIFLDEINSTSLFLQVKLLRVLQEREFERVGDHRTISIDVRIIAAANLDLEKEVREKRFRDDLFYRLNVVAIRLPPLRERREDIPLLIDYFLDKYNRENGRNLRLMSKDLLNLLLRYTWPGNGRELENAIERAVVLSQNENFTEELLPLTIRVFAQQGRPAPPTDSPDALTHRLVAQAMDEAGAAGQGAIWEQVVSNIERALIEEAMKRCDSVKLKAADYLGINRNTLNKKYHELGLDRGQPEGDSASSAA
jgi:transcriptional regulator with PAS, ATPase and Fis domain